MRDREPNPASRVDGGLLAVSRPWSGVRGQTVGGRYRLRSPLGRGGMGEVWRATHLVTGRSVALKLLSRNLCERQEMRRRFLREARAAARVNHPNVIEVLDAFDDGGLLALVMPLLQGEVLARLLAREGPLSVASTLEFYLPLVAAVDAAHAQGIVHRDLKPDNVFLVSEGGRRHVKVLDFGIAKLMDAAASEGAPLTVTGSPLGTLCYMAPEQCLGDSSQDHLVDVWALGVILYESLSGRRPIEGQNLAQIMKASLTAPITPLTKLAPSVPRDIGDLALEMLSSDKAKRPQTLQEVARRLLGHLPPDERRALQTRANAPSSDGQSVLGSAPTVRWNPSDHAMLSSVNPASPEWSRGARWAAFGAAVGILLALLVLARRSSLPLDRGPTTAGTSLPSTVYGALPLAHARTAVPLPNAPRPTAPTAPSTSAEPAASAAKPAATAPRASPPRPGSSPSGALPSAWREDAGPAATRGPSPSEPRPIDKDNPFAGKANMPEAARAVIKPILEDVPRARGTSSTQGGPAARAPDR